MDRKRAGKKREKRERGGEVKGLKDGGGEEGEGREKRD